MRSADLLFLPMHNLPPGIRAGTVPGKTYEYLASGRPILAAAPEGDARDLLLQAGAAHICQPDDTDAIAAVIAAQMSRDARLPGLDSRFIRKFEYQRLSEHVAELIDHVVQRPGRRPRARQALGQPAITPMFGSAATGRRWPDPKPNGVRAILLAYYFPPIGGAGAQRTVKFARYLPEAGVSVDVITGSGVTRDRWSPLDESLSAELPGETNVIRVGGPEPLAGSHWRRRAERWLGIDGPWSRWWVGGALASSLELGGEIDLIIASMSPYVSAEAASRRAGSWASPGSPVCAIRGRWTR